MSDDEEVIYAKRQKTIHYGTLEDTMLERAKLMKNENSETSAPTSTTIGKADIPEYFDIENEM